MLRFLAVVALLGALLTTADPERAGAAGRSIYVSVDDGRDGASGGPDDPLRTINAAMLQVEPGDTVWVDGGVYDEQADVWAAVRLHHSGRPDAWISLRAMPGERPLIMAEGHNGIQTWGSSYWHIEGFEVDGSRSTIDASGAGIAWGDRAHHVRIVDNWVHDFRGGGIAGIDGDHLHIEGNRVWGNARLAPMQTSGISLYQNVAADDAPGFHNVISGNVVYDNENLVPNPTTGRITDGNCIIIDDFRHTQYDSSHPRYVAATLITNNICFDNGGRGVHVYLADNVHIANNTVFRNTRGPTITSGELSAMRASDVTFVNNLVVSRDGVEPVALLDSTGIEFRGNAYIETPRASPDSSEHRFSLGDIGLSNPVLDPRSVDLRPVADSPLVGLGEPDPTVAVDFDGEPRPPRPTIGALEPAEPVEPAEPAEPPSAIRGQTPYAARGLTAIGSEGDPSVADVVALFAANGDGSRAASVGDGTAGPDGAFGFSVDDGCYVAVFNAPAGHEERAFCVVAGRVETDLDAVLR